MSLQFGGRLLLLSRTTSKRARSQVEASHVRLNSVTPRVTRSTTSLAVPSGTGEGGVDDFPAALPLADRVEVHAVGEEGQRQAGVGVGEGELAAGAVVTEHPWRSAVLTGRSPGRLLDRHAA